MPAARPPVRILVYRGTDAPRYAELIRAPAKRVEVRVAATPAEAAALVADVDVLYAWKFPPELYARAPGLRWLQAMGAGVDWALAPELPPGVTVTRAPGVFGPWMAEYILGWCAWVTQRMATYREAQRQQRWRDDVLPDRLAGKTLAIVGLGDIGRTIARLANAVGLRVVGVSRTGRSVSGVARVYRISSLHRALGEADFVALVLPLTPETRGLIGPRELAAMRPAAWLLNVGRGAVVDEAALLTALDARRIAGAILDVFAAEPLPPGHPFWGRDDVVVTPHISGPDVPAAMAAIFDDNLRRFLTGRPLRHVVDRRRGY